ncbi:DnaA/Hda family protein [uncultured Moraxella sp.]|uniref:DnaA ATPase domain-containing protein n=1 Tax=uncultured Moraxella sp. TaxID=263769 RepID=UPI0025FDF23D|nr:DnaA/Hda family protein [uncultured Moraxella sp.]
MTDLVQDSLNVEIRQDARIEDFASEGFRPIIEAIERLADGQLRELFITGGHGFGKTHLAQAVYDYFKRQTDKSAISLQLEELIEQDPQADTLVGLEMFDLIIFDDLQTVKKSYEWQEGLFHLINRLYKHRKQILYLADCPAREIHLNLNDLQTRLSLAPMLALPDHSDEQDRRILIDTIIKKKSWRLPDEITAYLLAEGPRNAGGINTVLDHIRPLLSLQTRSQLSKKAITEVKNIILRESFLLEISASENTEL